MTAIFEAHLQELCPLTEGLVDPFIDIKLPDRWGGGNLDDLLRMYFRGIDEGRDNPRFSETAFFVAIGKHHLLKVGTTRSEDGFEDITNISLRHGGHENMGEVSVELPLATTPIDASQTEIFVTKFHLPGPNNNEWLHATFATDTYGLQHFSRHLEHVFAEIAAWENYYTGAY